MGFVLRELTDKQKIWKILSVGKKSFSVWAEDSQSSCNFSITLLSDFCFQ